MSDVKESPDLLVKPSFHRKSKYTRDGEKKKMSEESIVIEQLRKIDRLFVERDPAHLHGIIFYHTKFYQLTFLINNFKFDLKSVKNGNFEPIFHQRWMKLKNLRHNLSKIDLL